MKLTLGHHKLTVPKEATSNHPNFPQRLVAIHRYHRLADLNSSHQSIRQPMRMAP